MPHPTPSFRRLVCVCVCVLRSPRADPCYGCGPGRPSGGNPSCNTYGPCRDIGGCDQECNTNKPSNFVVRLRLHTGRHMHIRGGPASSPVNSVALCRSLLHLRRTTGSQANNHLHSRLTRGVPPAHAVPQGNCVACGPGGTTSSGGAAAGGGSQTCGDLAEFVAMPLAEKIARLSGAICKVRCVCVLCVCVCVCVCAHASLLARGKSHSLRGNCGACTLQGTATCS